MTKFLVALKTDAAALRLSFAYRAGIKYIV